MRLWIDECLSPALVQRAHALGYDATCSRDRGLLSLPDRALLPLVVGEGFALVTNNDVDFVGLCAAAELHAGLIVMPQLDRARQLACFRQVVRYIERRAARTCESAADWMLNRVVEAGNETGLCRDAILPHS